MIRPAHSIAIALLASFSLLSAGCAMPRPVPPPAPIAVSPDRAAELDTIVAALDRGDPVAARPRIAALLARDPADPDALLLRRSIDDDPVMLLGTRRFAYTVRRGETMIGLSQRFLGSRFKSYALARFNGIAVPATLTAGTVLRMPGSRPPLDAGPRPPRRSHRPASSRKPAPPKADPAAARQARSAALIALGQGRIADALAALRRAAVLAPGDPLIQRDLTRVQALAVTPRH